VIEKVLREDELEPRVAETFPALIVDLMPPAGANCGICI
jgi:hypothetical protein